MEQDQLRIRLAVLSENQPIQCHNLQNGQCVARRTCAQILAGTRNSIDPLVQQGREIAQKIVESGATYEAEEGNCIAPSQDEAEKRCNGFLPVLPLRSPSTTIDV